MSGQGLSYWSQVDLQNNTLTLGEYQKDAAGGPVFDDEGHRVRETEPKGRFSFQEPEPDVMLLDGQYEAHAVHAKLHADKFFLTSHPFHWINEHPRE
jgi:hypothetical protein